MVLRRFKGKLLAASCVVSLAAFMPAGSVFAAACMTGVTVNTADVVSNISTTSGSALTSASLSTTSTSVVDSVTQTKNPEIGLDLPFPLPDITLLPAGLVVTNVSSTSTDVLDSASLTTTSADFINSVTPTFTPVVTNVTPQFSGAVGTGPTAFACGQNATATGPQASAFGNEATAVGAFTTALGGSSSAFFALGSTAVGANSNADFSAFSSAFGADANVAFSLGSTATGAGAQAALSIGSTATGAGSDAVLSILSTATGANASASLSVGSTATGAFSNVSGTAFSTATGFASSVTPGSEGGVAMGAFATADGNNATAVGAASFAAQNGTAIGSGAVAAPNATAVGRETAANAEGSVAIGRDSAGNSAVSNQQNEFVLGTENHTYTAPGITSDLSRARQSGPLEVATTDSNGHLASDGGLIFNSLSELGAGIAIAMSLENPDLVANERFGIAANLGFFEGNVALGVAMMGVLGHNFAGYGERWALSGGVGISLDEEKFAGHEADRVVAGRAGVQVSW